MELVEELQLAAEPPAPPRRSKYASGGQLGEIAERRSHAGPAALLALSLVSACHNETRMSGCSGIILYLVRHAVQSVTVVSADLQVPMRERPERCLNRRE